MLKNKYKIEDMQKIAKDRGGKCLSSKYINVKTKLQWKCKEGHIWESRPHNILQGNWCPYCANKKQRDTLRGSMDEMQKIAKQRGGRCLSKAYINALTKLKWQCKEGHKWAASLASIKSGHWCPICGIKKQSESHKRTIEEMQEIAKNRGGKCLSKTYVHGYNKLKWQCKNGHI